MYIICEGLFKVPGSDLAVSLLNAEVAGFPSQEGYFPTCKAML